MPQRTTGTQRPVSSSFQAYVQREIIELKSEYSPRTWSPGVEVIGGNREVGFHPFSSLDTAVNAYPQYFDKGHPLTGLGPWQRPALFRPYAKLPTKGDVSRQTSWSRFQATLCEKLALLYIMHVKEGASFHFTQRTEGEDDYPPVNQWTQLDNLRAGDIVVLSGSSIFSTKFIGSLLLTEAASISCRVHNGFDIATCTGRHIDASSAHELVARPANVARIGDATVMRSTVEGVASSLIMLGESETMEAVYAVKGAYAFLATRSRKLHIKSLHGDNELLFQYPPSGCIVRGGTKLSITGFGSALILSKPL